MSRSIPTMDLFCGAGGSSFGAESAGARVVAAIDNWRLARDTYLDNFPGARFFLRDAEAVSPQRLLRVIGEPVRMILASPECTSHTCAKGNGSRSESSRMTAFQVVRYARTLLPRWIIVENVIQMRSWDRYTEWLSRLQELGYNYREQVLNASDFGVPQSRKRLFVILDRLKQPPEVRPPRKVKSRTVFDVLDLNGKYPFTPLDTPGRAIPTLERARRAMEAMGKSRAFLLVYYGTDGAGGWQTLKTPLRTVTTLDRFAYVRPVHGRHMMRMLQVPELKKAMGFPASFRLDRGTRRDKIKLIGNGVCPPVMSAIVRAITRDV